MTEVGIWNVTAGSPDRFQRGAVDLERELETWIEQDSALIQQGLSIVGRQVQLESGRLDLLAIDPTGQWAIIEIKRGNVRRETIVQALDYAACIKELPAAELAQIADAYLQAHGTSLRNFLMQSGLTKSIFDDRNLNIFVVGTGRDVNLERLTRFLAGTGVAINVVNIEVFERDGQRLLLRHLTELDIPEAQPRPQTCSVQVQVQEPAPAEPDKALERLFRLAKKNKVGTEFAKVFEVATGHGLYPRLYKWSIMYTPPQHKGRVLLCAWVNPVGGKFDFYVNSPAFAEFFPVSDREASKHLGRPQRYRITMSELEPILTGLDRLFEQIAKNS